MLWGPVVGDEAGTKRGIRSIPTEKKINYRWAG